ncbi:acetyl-CoA acetyltransferase [Halosimplex carlsbadense 2-9-1]|uniref:Acetyl-CoA acetyltransferase n=1 Tax=Halosimplex carlsbadense 2-9-1 TaxID=797114 RepID=M0CP90_9EURY|nr:thiolase family protein [Halosimplex carlsbadense]ELZ25036.1 acetyl-CoA acetyltransferase [Halosimplex carlsbadense 2-9-1]
MTDVVIVDGSRTAHGAMLGSLSDVRAPDLGATVLEDLIDRSGVEPEDLDWVGLGNAVQAGVGQVPARQAVTRAGLPEDTPATTVNEASGSGLRAITLAADRIAAGRADIAVGGGMESMSNAPYLLREHREGRRHGNTELVDAMIFDALWDVGYDAHMGELTERLAEAHDVSREEQDRYALRSNRHAAESVEDGRFDEEIVPVEVGDRLVTTDEGPRADTSLDRLGQLAPAFRENGTITPGNASKLADGAGGVVLASAEAAREHGLGPMVHVEDYAVAYRDPAEFSQAIGDAIENLLGRNDLTVDDVDHYEVNEAFAAQTVYVRDRLGIPEERLNPLGGAVALGHPIGASGGILTTTIAHAMVREDHDYGVVGMSVGGGGAVMALLSR